MQKKEETLRDKLQGYSTEQLMSFIKPPDVLPSILSSSIPSSLSGISKDQIWQEVLRRDGVAAYFEQLKKEDELRELGKEWNWTYAAELPGAKEREQRLLELYLDWRKWREYLAKTQEYQEKLRKQVLDLLRDIGESRSSDHQLNQNDFTILKDRTSEISPTRPTILSFETAWRNATQREKFLKETLGFPV